MLRNDWCDPSTVLRAKGGWAGQYTLVILACGGRGRRTLANQGYMRPCFKIPKVRGRGREWERMSKNKGRAGDRASGPLCFHNSLL